MKTENSSIKKIQSRKQKKNNHEKRKSNQKNIKSKLENKNPIMKT